MASAAASAAAVSRAILRSALRAARDVTAVAADRGESALSVLPRAVARALGDGGAATSPRLARLVTAAFARHAAAPLPEAGQLQDMALRATAVTRERLAALRLEHYAPRPDAVAFRVGQVVQHRLHGWHGVIVGYDPTCAAPPEWQRISRVADLPSGTAQPFYHVLVDVRDRLRANAQPAPAAAAAAGAGPTPPVLLPVDAPAYVAQDNMRLWSHGEAKGIAAPGDVDGSGFVLHPHLPLYFHAYNPHSATYTLAPSLQALYADDHFDTIEVVSTATDRVALAMSMTPGPAADSGDGASGDGDGDSPRSWRRGDGYGSVARGAMR